MARNPLAPNRLSPSKSPSATTRPPSAAYSQLSIGLHWLSALLVLSLWPMGKIMDQDDVGFRGAGLYSIHIWVGLVVCSLTILRAVHHLSSAKPERLAMPRWQRILFVLNHYGLYLVLLAASLTGIGMLLRAGFLPRPFSSFKPIIFERSNGPTELHETISTVFMLLFVLHIVGVVSHQATHGRTLRRMGVPIGD